MTQYRVTALEKDMPFPANCVLSWIIWVALNPSIIACRSTSAGGPIVSDRGEKESEVHGPQRF